MKYNVLIVDDEFASRETHYKALLRCTESVSGFRFDSTFIDDPSKIETILLEKRFDLILTDVILDVYWRFNLQNLFDLLDKSSSSDSPIILVSVAWNDSNETTLIKALKSNKWKAFFKWDSISHSSQDDLSLHARQLHGILIQQSYSNPMHNVLDSIDDSIRIVHISDLHAGLDDFTKASKLAHHAADCIFSELKRPPHFIFVTGDITNAGLPDQFQLASEWISHFRSSLNSPPIFFVPGNHDSCLPLAASSSINWDGERLVNSLQDSIIHKSLSDYPLIPYNNFVTDYYKNYSFNQYNNDHSWLVDFFINSGFLIYGLNTSESPFPIAPPVAKISSSLDTIFQQLHSISRSNPHLFTIGLSHHCPVLIDNHEYVSNYQEFNNCFMGRGLVRTNLILCGHTHGQETTKKYMAGYDMVIAISPSVSKEVKGFSRGFNLIKINKKCSEFFNQVVIDGFTYANSKLNPGSHEDFLI